MTRTNQFRPSVKRNEADILIAGRRNNPKESPVPTLFGPEHSSRKGAHQITVFYPVLQERFAPLKFKRLFLFPFFSQKRAEVETSALTFRAAL
ncbi:MAG TPA: hypothetical protein VHC00_15405 [Rhizobiaceae bacterium]|nr:hypothetical protein [Rhizobiaceae bacterium]